MSYIHTSSVSFVLFVFKDKHQKIKLTQMSLHKIFRQKNIHIICPREIFDIARNNHSTTGSHRRTILITILQILKTLILSAQKQILLRMRRYINIRKQSVKND